MCGRFSLTVYEPQILERFNVSSDDTFSPRYNIAPSQNIAVILNERPTELLFVKWGLIPSWVKVADEGIINARAETVDEKPFFKNSFLSRRCLIIADGFYEWKKVSTGKIPYRFTLKNNELFAFAGIWDKWQKDDQIITSCAIITVDSNEIMQPIHDRMPVILKKENERKWLMNADKSMLVAYDSSKMKSCPISNEINNPKNDNPSVIKPLSTLDMY